MTRPSSPQTRVLLAASLVLLVGCSTDEPPAPTGYRISYDVVTPDARTTEVVEVVRGELSRRVAGDLATTTTTKGVYQRSGGTWHQLAVVGPGEVGEDLQLTAALDWAGTVGIARRLGSSTVAGLPCTQWRTAEPLDAGGWAAATAASETVSCVDAEGRLLADAWTVDRVLARSRTATALTQVVVRPFDGASPTPIAPGLVTTGVTAQREPRADLVVPQPPPGGQVRAVADVVEVAPGTIDVVRRTHRVVYVVGTAWVVLDQVRAEGLVPGGVREVRLGALGTGRVAPTAGGLVLEVGVGDGLLRVRSGMPFATTVAWLSSLALG